MEPKAIRVMRVRQALASAPYTAPAPTSAELHLLTQYVLGQLSLELANELLRTQGRTILAHPTAQVA